jgi:hypothetical protein
LECPGINKKSKDLFSPWGCVSVVDFGFFTQFFLYFPQIIGILHSFVTSMIDFFLEPLIAFGHIAFTQARISLKRLLCIVKMPVVSGGPRGWTAGGFPETR